MYRRRSKGKRIGPYYFRHPVTGKRTSTGTDDRELAKAIAAKAQRESVERKAGIFIPSFVEQTDTWLELNQSRAGSNANKVFAEFWKPHFKDYQLNDITKEVVHDVIKRERPITLSVASTANNTANDYVDFVRKIVRSAGVTAPKFHRYPELRASKRWLRPEEWALYLPACYDDLADASTFSVATGLREANVMFFERAWLLGNNDRAVLPASVTKSDREYGIPLNETAIEVIKRRLASKVSHPRYLFLDRGKEWKQWRYYKAVQAAAESVGLIGVNVHAFRHTFASWLLHQGVADSIRKRLGCWSLGTSADAGYLHFDVEWLRPYAQKLDPLLCLSSVTPLRQATEPEGKRLRA
jgi:integrase